MGVGVGVGGGCRRRGTRGGGLAGGVEAEVGLFA